MNIEQVYGEQITSKECVATLKEKGALLLRGFVAASEQSELTREVLSYELNPVDRSDHKVPEQFHDIGWEFAESPPAVKALGHQICTLVRPALPAWFINQVRGQLYASGEAGIGWHRDYKRDLGIIAIASFIGASRFEARLEHGEIAWELEPGDLVLMRGALLNGKKDDRPQHRILPPITGQRLSIAYRQVSPIVPKLEA